MKLQKRVSMLLNILLGSVFLIMVLLIVISRFSANEPTIFGYQVKTVLSGSMEPSIKAGSIIAVKPGGDMTRFNKGDVITYMRDENVLITHRVIDVRNENGDVFYTTKGDNNATPDTNEVWSKQVVAEYDGFTIPYMGYIANYSKSKVGSATLLLVPAILFILYALSLFKEIFTDTSKSRGKEL
ncbi:signal peptidase I SipW [Cytobacillus sp. IB215316]|uniref:signal peptidase I SipW n=1 Tax=Cytobacillus sp. IB215316 TaxID=3097354 RepID=UPI002A0C5028|nr:signal peptidase I [Cytobacillus sp. IB215316]MDX8360801.1 signal peptidase I [Cytobacillus sp. IB215316]